MSATLENKGLAALTSPDFTKEIAELTQKKHDQAAAGDLYAKLEVLCPANDEPLRWERNLAVGILAAVTEHVGKIMDSEHPSTSGEPTIIRQHPATQVLSELTAALQDLDKGHVDERLRQLSNGGSSAYNALERSEIETYLRLVDILVARKGTTIKDAQQQVAEALEELNITVRGETVTAKKLSSWRRYPPGSR